MFKKKWNLLTQKFMNANHDHVVFSRSSHGFLILLILIIALITHLLSGYFFTSYTLISFVRQATFTCFIGVAQMLVLMVGGIDLSVASMAALPSILFAWLLRTMGLPFALCLAIGLLSGVVLGLINGLFVSLLELPSFIVTLCTSYLFKGIVYVTTGGAPITHLPYEATRYGVDLFLGIIPYPTLILLIIAIALHILLTRTSWGRHLYAVGDNEKAASIVGIRSKKVKISAYVLCGLICATAGILSALRIGSAQLNIGSNWVMPSITAAVIGGTSMKGGTGNIIGTLLGGLFLALISFSISVLGMASYWTDIFTGLIILATVSFDTIRAKRQI